MKLSMVFPFPLIIAGWVSLGALQGVLAASPEVAWSDDRDNKGVNMQPIVEAAREIAEKCRTHHPLVRFSHHGVGGTALVPLWAYSPGSRCSPDFELAPFDVPAGQEVWVDFEFVNIQPEDQARIAFAIKADKPGRTDRYRFDHDVGNGSVGNAASMSGPMATPTDDDYGYYFLDRGEINTDEILTRNPSAAIRITISAHPRGK